MSKKVPLQTIQFSISTQFVLFDRSLSGATPPGKCGPGNDGNEGILRLAQSSNITGHSLLLLLLLRGWSYHSVEKLVTDGASR